MRCGDECRGPSAFSASDAQTSTDYHHAAASGVRRSWKIDRLPTGRDVAGVAPRRRQRTTGTTTQVGMLRRRCVIFIPLISLTGRVFLRKACHTIRQLGHVLWDAILGPAPRVSCMKKVGFAARR